MDDVSTAAMLARVGGSLAVVLLLAVLVARIARRTAGARRSPDGLAVRERVGLTRDTAAVVLETGGRRLLVGVSPHQVTLLADLSPGAAALTPAAFPGEAVPAPQQLAQLPAQLPTQPVVDPVTGVRVHQVPLSRKVVRELDRTRRKAVPPTQRGTGSVLDPRTWQQGVEALRDLTARRG